MSSTGQLAGQATPSASNTQLIIDVLTDYAKITGIDLSKNPLATTLEQSNSPEAVLQLLQGREKSRTVKGSRDDNRRLISCLSPIVKVLEAFSGILGEAVSLVPIPPANALFVGIDVLLAVASRVLSSYDAVLALFECLEIFLKHLEIYTTIPPTPIMTDIILKIMIELLSVLALATEQVKQGRFKNLTEKLLRESELDAVLQRLDRLTEDEARMTVARTLGVVHGLVGNIKVVMEDGKASMDSIRPDLIALHQMLNKINKMKRDKLQSDVQRWLSPPDPSTIHEMFWKERHTGTAAWFFESNVLTRWKAIGSFLWIHGKPGSGKSTLLSSIIQDIKGMHAAGLATMAYYYFDFWDVKKQNCYGFLSSLILQLSAESDSCYNILCELYPHNSGGIRKPTISVLKKCMTDMLSLPRQGPIYIIVDALNECPNFSGTPSARKEVLEFIEELVDLKLPDVHLCVASRPEIDIRMVLEPLTSLRISLHDESGQKEDMIEYIKFVVHSDWGMRRWKEEDKQFVIDTLSDKADGMFRWVVCQVDRLCRSLPTDIPSALADLPKSLDKTYEQALLGIEKEKREYARRLFNCLSVSIRPLRVEELAEVFTVQFGATGPPSFSQDLRPPDAEEAVLSACSSLISIVNRRGSKVVQFSHFSVKEYLASKRLARAEERLSYYHILPKPAHTILAQACLSVLLQLDDKIGRDTIGRFPLASYAARHWVDHAQFGNVSAHVQEAMECLFDPANPHFAAWVWLYDIDRPWIEPMSKIHPTRPEAVPLYYASLCGFGGLVGHIIVTHLPDISSRGGSHTTPLHAASVKGHLEVASLLLKCRADPNSRDNQGRAPLHRLSQGALVTMQSSLDIARLLVSSGANVNVTDDQGGTPLHAAARYGCREIAQLLLASGASLDVRNMDQETPLHLACGNGKLDVSHFLINRGSDMNSRDKNGFIPIQIASRFGHVGIVQLLLDCGSDVNTHDTQRWTLLHYASRSGDFDLVRLLVNRSADVDVHGADSWTALHFASHGGHLDIAKLLINHGANVDSQKDNQETPLDLASRIGHLEVARFLIESGAAVCARDENGWTPFHSASYFGHVHVAKFLLEFGIDVDIRNGSEETSLYLASSSGKLDIVRFLIEQGADIHVTDSNGWNPAHIASHNGHLDIVHLLINIGSPVDILNGTQKTPLALASMKGKVEVGRFLIERGADVNARDKRSRVPLHLATQYGHLDMVRLLLDHGVDANVQKDNLWSPLHLASAHGHLRITEFLVQRGARVDVFNGRQETPLYLAAGNGKVGIVRLLIDHGAIPDTINGNGWTPLHAASRRGHLGVVKLLLWHGADVKVLNKANKTAAELASENGLAEIAKFITKYKADASVRNQIRSTTLDSAQYGADEDEKDEGKASLHTASKEGEVHVIKSLLERGSDINARDAQFVTPLHVAAVEGNLEVVGLLIELGAEVDPRDIWGCIPLHLASRFGHLDVSRVLVNHGANVNAKALDYWTPMHLSAGNGYLGIVKLLLERGADVHAVNDEGETPYQISLASGYREIADLLGEHSAGRARDNTGFREASRV